MFFHYVYLSAYHQLRWPASLVNASSKSAISTIKNLRGGEYLLKLSGIRCRP